MNTLLKKAFSDLRSGPGRTLLALLALAIGVWGVGSMLVSYTILTRDLSGNFIRTRPAHIALTSPDFSRLDLAQLLRRPQIESAEFRDLYLARIEVYPDEWIPVWLFGVRDFDHQTMAIVRREAGAAVPPNGTMLMERDGLHVSNLRLGGHAKIRVGPTMRTVPISGISFDPGQAPATQDHFIYAYVNEQTYVRITGEPSGRRLLLRLRGVTTKQDVQAVANSLVGDLRARGIRIDTASTVVPNEHPHQWQLNTLLFLQGAIGFLALLMSAVLVSQLMASILAKQIRQIGILKAIGASSGQVLAIYLTMVLLLGLASGTIALPLAVRTGYAFSYFVAGKLNFDILTSHLPLHVYGVIVVASLLLPIVLSLPAITKGIRVPVRDALSDYGITARATGPGAGEIFAGRLPSGMLLAVRNTFRQKRTLAVTVATMALGVAIFNTGFNVRASLAALLADVSKSMRHDVQVVLSNPIPRERALSVFRDLPDVERIETWNGGRGELQSRVVATGGGVGIVALPYDTDLMNPKVVAGRWLRPSGAPEVVLNQQALDLYGNPPVGSQQLFQIGGRPLAARLVGVIEEFEKPKIYMDEAEFDALANPHHDINSLMFVARDRSYDRVMLLKKRIEKAVSQSDLDVLYVMSQAERVKVIYDHLNIILTSIVSLSLVVLVVSALGMASATAIKVLERTREIGVLRAIGATPRVVFYLFVTEGMVTSLFSILIGMVLAWPLSSVASIFFGRLMLGKDAVLHAAFSGEGVLITLVATLVFSWLASRLPAERAVRMSTRDALAYE